MKIPVPTWRVATSRLDPGKAPVSVPPAQPAPAPVAESGPRPKAKYIELPGGPEGAPPAAPREAPRAAPISTEELVRSALQESQARGGNSKGRIVVADSVPGDLETLRRMLEDKGYEVFAAKDGEEAVAMIREHKPALAIVDLKTDKLSGFQVVQTITEQYNPLNKDVWQIPFFMTCPKVTGRDRQYAISLGVRQYFVKPLTPAMVCPKIEKHMGLMSGI
ncbi:MAG TPA: response regulator [Candidatus Brocadiia bacterium]|nr:response regulator [Candidatus Brocadiia bacterium]